MYMESDLTSAVEGYIWKTILLLWVSPWEGSMESFSCYIPMNTKSLQEEHYTL